MHPTCNEYRQAYRQGVYIFLVNNFDVWFKMFCSLDSTHTYLVSRRRFPDCYVQLCHVHPQKCAQDEVMSQASHHSTDSTLLGRRQSTLVAWLSVRMTNALPFYHGRYAADQTGNTSSVGLAGRWLIGVSFSTNHSAKVKQNLCSLRLIWKNFHLRRK